MVAEHRTLLASAERTATTNTDDISVPGGIRGVRVVIDVTAITDTPSVVPKIRAKDALSGQYIDLLEGAAITGTGTTALVVYPGTAAVANEVADLPLGSIFRVSLEHADTDAITYSVAADLVP